MVAAGLVLAATNVALASESTVADSLRGTEEPLAGRSGMLRQGAHYLVLPVYGAWRVVAWPLEQSAGLYDRSARVRLAASLLSGGTRVGAFRFSLFGNFDSGEGFSEFGVESRSEEWPRRQWKFRTKAGFLDRDRNILDLKLSTPEDRAVCLHLRSHFESKTNRRFHGLGPDSPSRKLLYDSRGYLFETWLDLALGEGSVLDVASWYTHHDLDDIGDRIDEAGESAAVQLPGDFALAEEIEYVGFALRCVFDRRDRGAYSRRGRAFEAEFGWNGSLRDSNTDYLHYRAQAQVFIPLSTHHTRTLALRVFAGGVAADDAQRMPFTEMERPGGRLGMRGYPRNRFADLRQVTVTVEYRYRLTQRTQAAFFGDWGSVASRWEDLRLGAIDPSFGFGLNFGQERFSSVHVAWSREGVQLAIGSDTLFTLRSRRLR